MVLKQRCLYFSSSTFSDKYFFGGDFSLLKGIILAFIWPIPSTTHARTHARTSPPPHTHTQKPSNTLTTRPGFKLETSVFDKYDKHFDTRVNIRTGSYKDAHAHKYMYTHIFLFIIYTWRQIWQIYRCVPSLSPIIGFGLVGSLPIESIGKNV